MNARCHRILFNRKRGMLVVVAENAVNQGKSAGNSRSASRDNDLPAAETLCLGAIRPLTLLVKRLLAAALPATAFASLASAQIVSDPRAPGQQQATVLAAPNGVPLVNIQTPSAAGVSRNTYSQFDIQQQGAILNNSRNNISTRLGGFVQGNPWLANGSARVIVNEVNSGNASQLRGYVEVAGQRAQLVVANPSGVSCDGCGFINASRATLTTGAPVFNGGSLEGYRVHGGTVQVDGLGMDAGSTDYTEVIARAVQLNAGIWAKELQILAGPNQVAVDANGTGSNLTGQLAANGPTPAFAIDTALLGGMYAGKIKLIATEQGVGVSQAGKLYADIGEVVITADGKLVNAGQMNTGSLHIETHGGIENRGGIYAAGSATLTTVGYLDNHGVIATKDNLSLDVSERRGELVSEPSRGLGGASSIVTNGTNLGGINGTVNSLPGSVLAAGVLGNAAPGASAHLTVTATQGITAAGRNFSTGNQLWQSRTIDLANSETTANRLAIFSNSGDIGLVNSKLSIADEFSAQTNQWLRTDGATITAGQINVGALTLSNAMGQISGAGPVRLTLGTLNNQGGLIQAKGEQNPDLILNASGLIDNSKSGQIFASGELKIGARSVDNTGGQITAGKSLSAASVEAIDNSAGLLASNLGMRINAARISNRAGTVASLHQDINIDASDGLDNDSGSISSDAALSIKAAALNNTQSGQIVSNGAATIQIVSNGAAISNARLLDNRGGQVQAQGPLHINVAGSVDNDSGLMRSSQDLQITAADIKNSNTQADGKGLEGKDIVLSAKSIGNRYGAIRSNTATLITSSGTIDNSSGSLSGGKLLNIADQSPGKSLAITNTSGSMIAGQQLTIEASSLTGEGKLSSLGNLGITLIQDFTNTGAVIADGSANMHIAGKLVNQSILAAGNTLAIDAGSIDNQVNGVIQAGTVVLAARDANTLTNRGLIDGAATTINAITLDNAGTGRIYGDHLAIAAEALVNHAENGVAGVIAARERLDVAANTIRNQEHALMFSAGDLAIGGALDADHHATGQASTLENASATIEALGNADIAAATIDNRNDDAQFALTQVTVGKEHIVDYQGAGSPNRYREGTPGVSLFTNESLHLLTPETWYEDWISYDYTRTTTETRIARTDPAVIRSGGALNFSANTLNNDKSQIIAGGAITGKVDQLNNSEVAGQRVITEEGTLVNHWRDHRRGIDESGYDRVPLPYKPAPAVQAIALTPSVYQQNTRSDGSGTQIAALSSVTVEQHPDTAHPAVQNSQIVTPVIQVMANARQNGVAGVVRSGGIHLSLPDNRLFNVMPSPASRYLVETDPAFTNYRNWLGSDYLLKALKLDVDAIQKRLGDGFHEQKLIREQVAQLTGRRFLEGYASDEAQYQALLDNAATVAQAQQLVPGVALSAAQMAQLTTDIVWLVEQEIMLPDGSTTKALVPQLYVHVQDGDLQSGGALIAAENIKLDVTGNLQNGGTIAGRQIVALTADNLDNLGGRILGKDVRVETRTDLNNIGGTIAASNSLLAQAGRDLNVGSTTSTQTNAQGSPTNVNRVAGLYVTGSNGTLIAKAERDANLTAAAIVNGSAATGPANTGADSGPAGASGEPAGNTFISAGNDIKLGTVTQAQDNHYAWDGKNSRSDSSTADTGTAIQTQGNLALKAGHNIEAKAAYVTSAQGDLTAVAGNDVILTVGQSRQTVDEAHQRKGRTGGGASLTIATHDKLDQTTALASTFSGKTATVVAEHDIKVTGSNVVSEAGTTLAAKNDVTVEAATNADASSNSRMEKRSGLMSSGGFGFTIGTQQQNVDQTGISTTTAASTIGSTHGNVVISAGNLYTQQGSDVLAPQGDVAIKAKRVLDQEARETRSQQTETRSRQSGLTVAVTSPVITAVQTAQQMSQAASNTSDSRMQVLAAANTAMVGKNTVDAVRAGQGETVNGRDNQIVMQRNPDGSVVSRDATAAERAGGIDVSVSLGASQSSSSVVQRSNSARVSNISGGNNVSITATGAGLDSNIILQGTKVKAGNTVTTEADNEVRLLAAKNSSEQHSSNQSSSASLGASLGTSGFLVTATASGARGNADGSDVRHDNARIEAGKQAIVKTGGNAVLGGGVIAAPQITADIGGELIIDSLQDTSKFDSKQKSLGGSLSLGAGKASGSLNYANGKINSDFASVAEQSGIKAGDGGFDVKVRNGTTLNGGVITSAQKAIDEGLNRFKTGGELITKDIQNSAHYSASSIGVNLGSGIDPAGKLTPCGTSAGIGSGSGHASSTSKAAISGIAGDKAARTGDKPTGIQKIFDADKVQKDVNAQVQITQTFGREASKAVADIAESKINELKVQQRSESDPSKREALAREQLKWEDGGQYRVVMHAVVGGLTGNVEGALGSAAAAKLAPQLNELQENLTTHLQTAGANPTVAAGVARLVTGSTAAGIGSIAGGGNTAGAVTALNEDANNRQLHPDERKFIEKKAKQLAATSCKTGDAKCSNLAQRYWSEQLTAEAEAADDSRLAKWRQDYLQKIAATGQAPNLEGSTSGGAAKYLDDARIARSALDEVRGQTIRGTDGKPITAADGQLTYFSGTEAQRKDYYLYLEPRTPSDNKVSVNGSTDDLVSKQTLMQRRQRDDARLETLSVANGGLETDYLGDFLLGGLAGEALTTGRAAVKAVAKTNAAKAGGVAGGKAGQALADETPKPLGTASGATDDTVNSAASLKVNPPLTNDASEAAKTNLASIAKTTSTSENSAVRTTLKNDAKSDSQVAQTKVSLSERSSSGSASGSSAEEIKASLAAQITELRSKLPSDAKRGGNMGIAEIDVPGVPAKMVASSRIDQPTIDKKNLDLSA
ncbi:MAG: hemagglutinin repeat-containing protein, partial [Janthinobacterium lividum]